MRWSTSAAHRAEPRLLIAGKLRESSDGVQLAPQSIRVNGLHPTNCNTDMLHSAPMYRAFRPDLENPSREDAELSSPVMQAMPIPYVEPQDISELVLFLASDDAVTCDRT